MISSLPPTRPTESFADYCIPDALLRIGIGDGAHEEDDEGLLAAADVFLASLPASPATTGPRVSDFGIDAILLAAIRECLALEAEEGDSVSDERTDRARYGLVPMLMRLGVWDLKRRLEDAALRAASLEHFVRSSNILLSAKDANREYVEWTVRAFTESLDFHGIDAEIIPAYCRVDGAARRLRAAKTEHLSPSCSTTEFYDMVVIVADQADCYRSLGALHEVGLPVPEAFRDLIAAPRQNGFSGLITRVLMSPPGKPVDATAVSHTVPVLLQTRVMNEVARYGIAQPQCYAMAKEGRLDPSAALCVRELVQGVIAGQSPQTITVFTRDQKVRGRVHSWPIPAGATVLDLAYRIHGEVGDSAQTAAVNSRRVASLGHILSPSDIVSIRCNESAPTLRTETDLPLVTTKRARRAIRRALNANVATRGRLLLSRHLDKSGLLPGDPAELNRLAAAVLKRHGDRLGVTSVDQLYRRVGEGYEASVSVSEVGNLLRQQLKARGRLGSSLDTPSTAWRPFIVGGPPAGITQLSICGHCVPAAGDGIVGVQRARQLTVHERSCKYIRGRPTMAMEWKREDRTVRGVITIVSDDRPLLVHNICERLWRRGCGLEQVSARADEYARARVTIHTYSPTAVALGDLLSDLRSIRSVTSVSLDDTSLTHEEQTRLVEGDWRTLRSEFVHNTAAASGPILVDPPPGSDRRRGPITVPYSGQKPTYDPRLFFGRGAEIEALIAYTASASNDFVIITGPRRIGKTSVALRFADHVDGDRRPFVIRVDLRSSQLDSSDQVLWRIAQQLSTLPRVDAPEYRGDPRAAIARQLEQVPERRRVLVILDEFGAVVESHRSGALGDRFFAWIRSTMDDSSHVSEALRLILVAPTDAAELLHGSEIEKHLDRLVDLRLGTLDRAAASEMILQPFNEQGVLIERPALKELITVTDGHPYYLILLLTEVAAMLNRHRTKWEVTAHDISACVGRLVGQSLALPGDVHEPGDSPLNVGCLHAVVQLQRRRDDYADFEAIVRKVGADAHDVEATLQRLVDFQLLEVRTSDGAARYRFVVPLVQLWLRRDMQRSKRAAPGRRSVK